jgi:hypothetical protein
MFGADSSGEGCYIDDPWGPGFLDRLQNRMVSSDGGVATFVNVENLPSELQSTQRSAVGYAYFNQSADYGSLNSVRGVTDEYSWFNLDQDHVDHWGIGELAY